ncbi:MAG: FAD-binding oxidoreductase [Rhodospirillales bacterium]
MSVAIDEPASLPHWFAAKTPPERPAVPLSEKLTTDCVVIGAGITGSSTAIHLRKMGRQVVQLELNEPGWGASGRAFGNVVAVSKHSDTHILDVYGPERGERLNQALEDGPKLVRNLIDEHDIDADLGNNDWLLAAHTPKYADILRRNVERLGKQGKNIRLLEADETARLVGSDYYSLSVLDSRSFGIKPLGYAQGLAHAAVRMGTAQYWQTPAMRIEKAQGAKWRVTTPGGEVVADMVFICTNAYGGDLWPGLKKTYIPVRGYCAVTTPLSENLFAQILPERHFVTDTRHLWSGIRKIDGSRLQLSTGGPSINRNGNADLAEATKRLKDVYPYFGDVSWEGSWGGWVAITANQLPRIFRLADGVFSALGYSGRGLSFSTMLGAELAQLAANPDRDDLILPVVGMKTLPFHIFAPFVAAAYINYFKAMDTWAIWRHARR